MNEDPLSADAALARVAEAGDLDLVRGELPVAVGFDDHRRVVAELEPDPFARRSRADPPPDIRRTGERDEGDVGMIDEGVSDGAATPRDDVQLIGWEPALVDEHLGERDGAERRLRC